MAWDMKVTVVSSDSELVGFVRTLLGCSGSIRDIESARPSQFVPGRALSSGEMVLLDADGFGLGILQLVHQLRSRSTAPGILILGSACDTALPLLSAGADAVLLTPGDLPRLADAIQAVRLGTTFLSSSPSRAYEAVGG